jgi:hypothetical protein
MRRSLLMLSTVLVGSIVAWAGARLDSPRAQLLPPSAIANSWTGPGPNAQPSAHRTGRSRRAIPLVDHDVLPGTSAPATNPFALPTVKPVQLAIRGYRNASAALAAPSIGLALPGLGSDTQPYNPADVQVAVGAGRVVEVTNAAYKIWTTQGAPVKTDTLGSFFSTTTVDRRSDSISDPRVVYDSLASRWFVLAMNVGRQETDIAVSSAPDPSGGWWIYTMPSAGCPEQPRRLMPRG